MIVTEALREQRLLNITEQLYYFLTEKAVTRRKKVIDAVGKGVYYLIYLFLANSK